MNEPENSGIIQKNRIDTNIIIRYLMGDGESQAEKAHNLFKRAAAGEKILILCDTVFLESVFVLQSYYKVPPEKICEALRAFIRLPGIETDTNTAILAQALEFYEIKGIDCADALIAAKALAGGQGVYSFDNHFNKFPGIIRKEP